jgi:hypothetical protein
LPYQTPDHCEGNQFYDISHLKCVDCGNGTRATRDRLDCQCLAGYRIISKQGPLAITCQRCNSGHSRSTRVHYFQRKQVSLSVRMDCSVCNVATRRIAM